MKLEIYELNARRSLDDDDDDDDARSLFLATP